MDNIVAVGGPQKHCKCRVNGASLSFLDRPIIGRTKGLCPSNEHGRHRRVDWRRCNANNVHKHKKATCLNTNGFCL
ncbi:hypothetical protein BLOT_000836 [Blomia tropicalis]|nr:hypothetical protein BLOT_000836 [Blomia tropicalis]